MTGQEWADLEIRVQALLARAEARAAPYLEDDRLAAEWRALPWWGKVFRSRPGGLASGRFNAIDDLSWSRSCALAVKGRDEERCRNIGLI